MSSKNKNLASSEIEALSASIESLIEDIQRVRLANKFNKMTEVRLVDLQYTARLALNNLNDSEYSSSNALLDTDEIAC